MTDEAVKMDALLPSNGGGGEGGRAEIRRGGGEITCGEGEDKISWLSLPSAIV